MNVKSSKVNLDDEILECTSYLSMLMDDVHLFAFRFGRKFADDTEDHRLALYIVCRLSRGERRRTENLSDLFARTKRHREILPTRSRKLSHHCYEIVPAAKARHIPNSIATGYVKYI